MWWQGTTRPPPGGRPGAGGDTDLVVLDISMPGMDGLTVSHHMRRNSERVRELLTP